MAPLPARSAGCRSAPRSPRRSDPRWRDRSGARDEVVLASQLDLRLSVGAGRVRAHAQWDARARSGGSGTPGPGDVAPLAPIDEPRHLAVAATQEDLAAARLAGDEQHVRRLDGESLLLARAAATDERVAVAPDGVGDRVGQGVGADVLVKARRGELDGRRVDEQR